MTLQDVIGRANSQPRWYWLLNPHRGLSVFQIVAHELEDMHHQQNLEPDVIIAGRNSQLPNASVRPRACVFCPALRADVYCAD